MFRFHATNYQLVLPFPMSGHGLSKVADFTFTQKCMANRFTNEDF